MKAVNIDEITQKYGVVGTIEMNYDLDFYGNGDAADQGEKDKGDDKEGLAFERAFDDMAGDQHLDMVHNKMAQSDGFQFNEELEGMDVPPHQRS